MDKNLKLEHLEKLSSASSAMCPALSSFYKYKIKVKQDKLTNNAGKKKCERYHACPFCNTPFSHGNHRVRLVPKLKFDKRIKKLLRKNENSPHSLGKFQAMLVKSYKESCNKLIVTCFACKKTTKISGQSREDKAVQKQREIEMDKAVAVAELKSRKQKLKQKKKEKRKLKKLGLSANIVHGISVSRSNCVQSQSLSVETNSEKSLPVSSETPTEQVGTRSTSETSLFHSVRNIAAQKQMISSSLPQSVQSLQTQKQPIKHLLRDFKPVQNIGSKGAILSKKKKTKAKDFHQQLGKILEKEAKKVSGVGSLTDFLSSL